MGQKSSRQAGASESAGDGGQSAPSRTKRQHAHRRRIEGDNTLEMVVIMHRHGARFPNKAVPGDLNWPRAVQFWKDYSAQLTPTGSLQHHRLGERMAERYVDGSDLLKDIGAGDMDDAIMCITSNLQRTLMSAYSFLQGARKRATAPYGDLSNWLYCVWCTRNVPARPTPLCLFC